MTLQQEILRPAAGQVALTIILTRPDRVRRVDIRVPEAALQDRKQLLARYIEPAVAQLVAKPDR